LRDTKFKNVIAQGRQGTVVNAVYKDQEIALKLEILNAYPVTMTKRSGIDCDSIWTKIPGFTKLTQAYLQYQTRNDDMYDIMTLEKFQTECDFARKLSDLGIGPRVIYTGVCVRGLRTAAGIVDVGFLGMEKFDTTLDDHIIAMEKNQDLEHFTKSLRELQYIFRDLRKLGHIGANVLSHGDLHDQNVLLLRQPNRKFKVRVIDFGFTSDRTPDFGLEVELLIMEEKTRLTEKKFAEPLTPEQATKILQFIQRL
jgi:hypothetical protein